ncbi:MAG: hypothetical protein KJ795_06115 [Gammaproteobacteria bacterium]|nr:hypothetical protein [Gammaproteobacteria bacterium]MBU1776294.1 hypothetical protein [Gammaproteobacteria bacterium]MBU1969557.1 hypothetical protein [Gammaproteobacteria bacterium]
MLGIFGKKSDHPLADIKSVQELLNEVPKNDAFTVVHEMTDLIESLLEQSDAFRLDHQLTVLRMIDEVAQSFVRKLLRDYFSVQPPQKFQENRLWGQLDRFYTLSSHAYHDVLTRYRNNGRGASTIKPELALLTVRGIGALTGRLKMVAARYALVDPTAWRQLADFYNHAETAGYHGQQVPLYPGVAGTTSVTQEFAALLAWYGVSAGTLSPLREHISERLISHVGSKLTLGRQFGSGVLFAFDLAQPTPPMRANPESTVHAAVRFVGSGDALNQLNGLLKTLDKDIVPDDLNMCGAKYDPELVGEVARYLIDALTQPLPMRRSPRRKINVNLKVASGFYKMLEQTDVGLNFSNEEGAQWEVEDISATGFRSVIPASIADGIKIGALVGSKPENIQNWGAGIVRRLSRDANNNLHVGVEVLSPQIIGVLLFDHGFEVEEIRQIALYLNRPNDNSGEALLLMRPDTFSPSRSLSMELNDKGYLLLPLALVESGEDYDLARFRLMEQDASAEN